jgi:hypothetical protein
VVRFITCAGCGSAAKVNEERCPSCDTVLRAKDGSVPRHAAALLLGLTAVAVPAAGCSSVDGDGAGGQGGASQTGTGAKSTSIGNGGPSSSVTKYAGPGITSVTTGGFGADGDPDNR